MSVAMRGTIVLVCAAAGALGGIGCLIAGLFELQGFGTPQDSEPRVDTCSRCQQDWESVWRLLWLRGGFCCQTVRQLGH